MPNPTMILQAVPDALLALGILLCLYLFYSAKVELHAAARRFEAAQQESAEQLRECRAQLAELAERAAAGAGEARIPGPGLNLTHRAQVLRMARRGEAVPTIAAALGCARNEVELMLKVQRLGNPQSGSPAA